MAADLHIHALLDERDEAKIRANFDYPASTWDGEKSIRIGSVFDDKWGEIAPFTAEEIDRAVDDCPSIWVGEVSWLSAALYDDEGTFVPGPVEGVQALFRENDLVPIDDGLIEQVAAALKLENSTSYDVVRGDSVIEFLQHHKGRKAFVISW